MDRHVAAYLNNRSRELACELNKDAYEAFRERGIQIKDERALRNGVRWCVKHRNKWAFIVGNPFVGCAVAIRRIHKLEWELDMGANRSIVNGTYADLAETIERKLSEVI